MNISKYGILSGIYLECETCFFFFKGETPSSHPFVAGIFHENHPWGTHLKHRHRTEHVWNG